MPIDNLIKEIESDEKNIIKSVGTQTLFLFLFLGIITILYLLISSSCFSK